MKKSIVKGSFVFLPLFLTQNTFACINCNKDINQAIFSSTFYPTLFIILLPFFALGAVVAVISAISLRNHKAKTIANPSKKFLSPVPLTAAATVLGIGIGGFIVGIIFHQILQWHEMISNKIPPVNYVAKSINMFWDGIFHAVTLIITAAGIILLWQLLKRKDIDNSGYLLTGGLLSGFGLFNLLEGLMDHQILKLHNVKEVTSDKQAWNIGFLVFSGVLIIIGYFIVKKKRDNDAHAVS